MSSALLLLLLAGAPEDVPILVTEFTSDAGLETAALQAFTDTAAAQIEGAAKHRAMTSSDIRAVVGVEADAQVLGCQDAVCVSDIAGALGVELVVFGRHFRDGDIHVLEVKLVDSSEALVIAREVLRESDLGEFLFTLPGRVDRLLSANARGEVVGSIEETRYDSEQDLARAWTFTFVLGGAAALGAIAGGYAAYSLGPVGNVIGITAGTTLLGLAVAPFFVDGQGLLLLSLTLPISIVPVVTFAFLEIGQSFPPELYIYVTAGSALLLGGFSAFNALAPADDTLLFPSE